MKRLVVAVIAAVAILVGCHSPVGIVDVRNIPHRVTAYDNDRGRGWVNIYWLCTSIPGGPAQFTGEKSGWKDEFEYDWSMTGYCPNWAPYYVPGSFLITSGH